MTSPSPFGDSCGNQLKPTHEKGLVSSWNWHVQDAASLGTGGSSLRNVAELHGLSSACFAFLSMLVSFPMWWGRWPLPDTRRPALGFWSENRKSPSLPVSLCGVSDKAVIGSVWVMCPAVVHSLIGQSAFCVCPVVGGPLELGGRSVGSPGAGLWIANMLVLRTLCFKSNNPSIGLFDQFMRNKVGMTLMLEEVPLIKNLCWPSLGV